jgi:hypothetical protein
MKKQIVVLGAILCIIAGLCLIYTSRPASEPVVPFSPGQTQPIAAAVPVLRPSPTLSNAPGISSSQRPSLADRAGQFIPDTNPPPTLPPQTLLQNVEHSVRQYGQMCGGNPVGTNPEITSQLAGRNPKHINFIDAQAGMRVDPSGQLIDAWGTPYFFHQLSGSEMEIHSAGPDKIMWTADDLVVK